MLTRKLVARKKKKEKEEKGKEARDSETGFQEGGREGKERSREQDIVAHRLRHRLRRMHRVAPARDYARGISTRTRAVVQSIREIYGTDDGARTWRCPGRESFRLRRRDDGRREISEEKSRDRFILDAYAESARTLGLRNFGWEEMRCTMINYHGTFR